MPARPVTPPDGEPIGLDEAKAHLRLETALDDVYLGGLIAAARHYAEEYCRRGIMQQTWELVLDAFPACEGFIELPRGQLATELEEDAPAVTSVTYIDVDGVERTLATTEYVIDDVEVPGRVRLAFGKSWPATRAQWDAVRIEYIIGWPTADDVPAPVKQALLLALAEMYEKRTPEVGEMPAVTALLSPYRILQL